MMTMKNVHAPVCIKGIRTNTRTEHDTVGEIAVTPDHLTRKHFGKVFRLEEMI